MKYVVKSPAILGDTCNLASVAHSMATQRATAGGGWHEKTYDAMLAEYAKWLRDEARSGRLATSNSLGVPTIWTSLMNEKEPSDAADACRLAWVNLGQLNAWAEKVGHVFTVNTEGVPWIDERGVVGGALPGPFTITTDGMTKTVEFKHHQHVEFFELQRKDQAHSELHECQAPSVTSRPDPLATTVIAACFNGLGGRTYSQWMDRLGKQPMWLKSCVVTMGLRGKQQTQWDPVKIGAALIARENVKRNLIRGRFQSRPPLNPWLKAWEDYEYQLPPE